MADEKRAAPRYTREEKRAYYIGMGSVTAPDNVGKQIVREVCGSDEAVIASYQRGRQKGMSIAGSGGQRVRQVQRGYAKSSTQSFDVNDYFEAAMRRSYPNMYKNK